MADVELWAIQAQNDACRLILFGPDCSTGFTSDCVATYCKGSVLGACNSDCCASSDPAGCLKAVPSVDANQQGCATVHSFIADCTSATPGLFTLPATQQASCACYLSQVYQPDVFDEAADRCYTYLSSSVTESAAAFSTAIVDFCAKNGPASNTAVTTSVSTTSSSMSPTCSSTASMSGACTPTNSGPMARHTRGNVAYLLLLTLPFLLKFVLQV